MNDEVSENLIANERRELWAQNFNSVFDDIVQDRAFTSEPQLGKKEVRAFARYAAMVADCALEQFDKRFPSGGVE